MRTLPRLLPALLLIAAVGCIHRRPVATRDAELLTQAEMLEQHFTTVHDAVSSLRANWLNVRGTDSFTTPSQVWVYFDQTRLGGVDELRAVPVNTIEWVRHYNGVDATMRWGVGHSAGVILLSSHR